MKQKVVPITSVSIPPEKLGWKVVIEGGRVVAFENPEFGRFEHVAFVDETGKFSYDGIRKLDGPLQDDGHATPGAIMIAVEERPDGFYVHCQEEERPIIYDHIGKQQGVVVLGFAGGFSKKGEKPSKTALAELLQEQGVEVEEATVELIGWASDNRSTTETCIEVYLGRFRRKGERKADEHEVHEVILRTKPVRIDQFKPGRDGIVNSAYAMVVSHLGLISPSPPSPITDETRRFAALARRNPQLAQLILEIVEALS